MRFKRPEDLEAGDVFEEPESEEEFHGAVPASAARERYRVERIVSRRLFTECTTTRMSDGVSVLVKLVPWLRLGIVDDPSSPAPQSP